MLKRLSAARSSAARLSLRVSWALALLATVLAAAAAAAPLPGTSAEGVATMPVSEIRRGMKGYGYSVFSGTELQRFEVEVLGVLHNQTPNVSYVVARLSGQGLEDTGVVAGMSGSPVYIDDRLVGAVAYGWPFAKEPIAQITPIDAMRDLAGGVSLAATALPAAAGLRDLGALLPNRGTDGERLVAELRKLQPLAAGQGVGAVTWGFTGFPAATQQLLAQGLGSAAPAGQAAGDLPLRLAGGDAVAAVLVDGDFRLAATGTVTERLGDEVLAFGHPFLGIGPVDIPMAPAEVITVLSNQYNSFKISNFGNAVGSFQQDRLAGIRGRIGAEPTTIPVRVTVDGVAAGAARPGAAGPAQFDVRLARVPHLTPALLAVTVLGAQESAAQSAGPLGLDLEARFDLGDRGTVELAQSFDGNAAATEAAVYLLAFADFFINNGFDEVDLRGVEVGVRQHPAPRVATLVGGYAERTELAPGSDVRVHLDLVPWRGDPVRHDVTLRLPDDLPAGRYSLLIGDGVSLDAVRMQIEPASPQRLDQALRIVRRFHSRRELVALGVYAGDGLAVAGEVLPRLPGSLRRVWSAAASQSATPLRLTLAQEHVEELPFPIEGAVRIDLKVVRRQPFTAGNGADGAPAEEGAEPSANEDVAVATPVATGGGAAGTSGAAEPDGR